MQKRIIQFLSNNGKYHFHFLIMLSYFFCLRILGSAGRIAKIDIEIIEIEIKLTTL